jgi:hypothetical protein
MGLMSNVAPPGWYVDPNDSSKEHWWDGAKYNGTRAAEPAGSMPLPPPPAPSPQVVQAVYVSGAVPPVYGVSPKSRTVASILGFFLGGIGVDRFYLGNIGMGVAKLFLGWLTLGIWPLIDWIIILAGAAHDGEGLPVTNWQ